MALNENMYDPTVNTTPASTPSAPSNVAPATVPVPGSQVGTVALDTSDQTQEGNANAQQKIVDQAVNPGTVIDNTPANETAANPTAPTTSASSAQSSQPTSVTTVQGDTLASIAAANGTNIQALLAVNPSITNPNKIGVGQTINLPGAPKGTKGIGTANSYQNQVLNSISGVPDQSDSSTVRASAAVVSYPTDTGLTPSTNDIVSGLISQFAQETQQEQSNGYPNLESDYQANAASLNITALQTQYINLENIINGTPDDIRSEITKAGGTATESQVEAMADSRNKYIINQANVIQQQLSNAESTLSTETGLDEDQASLAQTKYNDSTGAISTLIGYYQSAQATATSNYSKLYASNGPAFLASQATGNPYLQSLMESSLGLAPGTLSAGSSQNKEAQDTWAKGISLAQGSAKIVELQQQGSYYGARTEQSLTSAAGSVTADYTGSPEYEAVSNGALYLNRIAGAMTTPGSVSDNDLLDAITKLDTGGQAITDAQVSTITGGRSVADTLSVAQQKLAKGGVLSADQRNQIMKLASAVFDNYQSTLAPLYQQTLGNLSAQGLTPEEAGLLDFNGIVASGAAQSSLSFNGQSYQPGQQLTDGTLTLTVDPTGKFFTGSDGHTYDSNLDIIK